MDFDLLNTYLDVSVDVIGIVKYAGLPSPLVIKQGCAQRRDIILTDANNNQINAVVNTSPNY